eukprot:TRINITY_DN1304_c0_g1_i5.p1 TRINITY_DN1304_c0_g1~~TRINITY_DN1304_c0_g1_i5.p1  ORF type:complete len:228 (+),score=36.85 TRINITY_DN1304_c0_g1_i5:100-783(+)
MMDMPLIPAPGPGDLPPSTDRFFDGEVGLVSTFDFDYDIIIDFTTKLRWAQFLLFPPAWITSVCCSPCFLSQNVQWRVRAQHVALTVDGIRYVTEKRKSLCGLSCSDVGKASKTVPYDKITDCDVKEPAGTACCCCIDNVLSVVNVDTASSGGGSAEQGPRHDLVLSGLKFPNEFKRAVWDMKRSHHPAATQPLAQAPPQTQMSETLLVEIRDELRKLNDTMTKVHI